MSVNRYKILTGTLPKVSGSTMVIPFNMDFIPVDNSELVETEFVEKETKKAINPIIDYEKGKFYPSFNDSVNKPNIPQIKINLFKSNNTPLYYSDLGITNDDVKFNRNRLLNTFLRFTFYNTNIPTTQKPIFYSTYYTQIGEEQRNSVTKQPLDVTMMPVSYLICDPILYPNNVNESFYIYWRKKDVIDTVKNFYTRVSLNNATNGKTLSYYALNQSPPSISSPNFYENLHINYSLIKDNDGQYKYLIDKTNRTISITPTLITINLYPLNVQ